MALCLEVLARSLVPSRATCPSRASPNRSARMTVRLLEDGHERRRVVSPEARQGAVVRLATSVQVHAGRLLARQPGQLARGTYPVQIAPGQYAEQRMRVVGLLAFRTRRD